MGHYVYFKVAQQFKKICLPMQEMQIQIQFLGLEDSLEKKMAIHSSILARKSNRQRRLSGCSPWDHEERDTT